MKSLVPVRSSTLRRLPAHGAGSLPRGRLAGWFGWLAILLPAMVRGEVALQLSVPPAETYVLGDPIPLYWTFRNDGPRPLGFMWEGCCRLNGRLEVSAAGRPLETIPSGQALAHMFAKAERLEPGVSRSYDTKVSDWVVLPGTGEFELRGRYRGVLPSQVPQVPRGLELWRDAAASDSIRLSLLGVADYLGQRELRERRRGLRMRVTGPPRLDVMRETRFELVLENLTTDARSVRWPEDFSLWCLDEQGRRAVPAAALGGRLEEVLVPAKGTVTRTFALTPDRFEGEPLGSYRMFVDLQAKPEPEPFPRVPSSALPVAWELRDADLRDLVSAAARGAGTGARNAPLKLLRVYLGDLQAGLARLLASGLAPEPRVLAERLHLASRLKPLSPKPGLVELPVRIAPGRSPEWWDSRITEAFGAREREFTADLKAVLDVRRHLGWEVGLALRPDARTPVAEIWGAVENLASVAEPLASAPCVLLATASNSSNNVPGRLYLGLGVAESVGSPDPEVRLNREGREWRVGGSGFVRLEVGAAWPDVLRKAVEAGSGTLVVRAQPNLAWGEVDAALRPLAGGAGRLELRR